MRTRYLKPGFFENEELAALPATTRLLFAGLWLIADKSGRLKDRPASIKGQLFPYDSTNVSRGLDQLSEAGFIKRYMDDDGQRLIWIPTWEKHQHPHKNEPASTLTAHPDDKGSAEGPPMSVQEPANVLPLSVQATANSFQNSNPHSNSKSNSYENSNSNGELSTKMPFTNAEVEDLLMRFRGVNVNARWKEFVDWIERGRGARPEKLLPAFIGFLEKTNGSKTTRAAAG